MIHMAKIQIKSDNPLLFPNYFPYCRNNLLYIKIAPPHKKLSHHPHFQQGCSILHKKLARALMSNTMHSQSAHSKSVECKV